MPRRPLQRLAVMGAMALALAGCSDDAPAGGSDGLLGEVLVSAAASLTDAFAEIEEAFEAEHPGVDVVLNLGGSSTLREQILGGAPTDVFASANAENMDRVVAAGAVAGEPTTFARNLLQIAVPTGNPAGMKGLEDFADASLFLGLCAEQVPCGAFARQALEKAGVSASIDTHEPDVRALLTKIAEGELDAGITYVTDVTAAEGVEGIAIDPAHNVTAAYPIAVVTNAPNPAAAARFVDFVLSGAGQAVLAGWGFASP